VKEIAVGFHEIFAGHENAHGEYKITGKKGSKTTGKANTTREPVTAELWEKHLKGEIGLGIIPIGLSNTCRWGAVDVDVYDGLNLEELSLKLPKHLVLCRSKSGGAHIFIFMDPAPAKLVRKKLTIIATAIGKPTSEIFPKQETIGPNDIGNWINMPYFGGESTTRYCIKGGVALTPLEFLTYAGESKMSLPDLVSFTMDSLEEYADDPEFEDAPPCLKYHIKNGFPVGSRNNALFSLGVFARKKFPTGWEDKIFEYNKRFMSPGTYSEVAAIIRSLNRRTYVYKCKDQPLCAQCNKELCAASPYGVQLAQTDEKAQRPNILDEVIPPIICYAPLQGSTDEPYWVFKIGEIEFNVTVDMAKSQNIFSREYLRQFHKVLLPIQDRRWVTRMNELLESAELRELAPDAGPEGQMWFHLEEFCTNKSKARAKDEIILGKPWKEDERIYFRSSDFMKYLDQQRFRKFSENELWAILKRGGAKHHRFNIKGKHVGCWSVSIFDAQNEPFDETPIPEEVGKF